MVSVCRWVDTRHQRERHAHSAKATAASTHIYREGGGGVASILVIASSVCIVSCHLSSLIIYFSGLTHVFTDILHITHTHLKLL